VSSDSGAEALSMADPVHGAAAMPESSLPIRPNHRWLRGVLTVISALVLGLCLLMWCWNEAPGTASVAVSQTDGQVSGGE